MIQNNIRRLRRSRKLSQHQLAEIIEVQQTMVSQWELGKSEPTEEQAYHLADFFGVSPTYVLGLTADQNDRSYLLPPDPHPLVAEDYREREILEVFRSLNGYGKDYFMQTVKMIGKWYLE